MLRFFRRIRQQSITNNRVGKYVLYAIGEILLVVIGILIAIQLNNWNEQEKQSKLEKEYYCRLLEDALLDQEQIGNLVKLAQDRLTASNQAVRLLLQDKGQKVEVGNQIFLSVNAIYADFRPNNSAFEDLKSGANMNIIGDKSVIMALNKYFNKVEESRSIILVNGQHAVDILFAHDDNFANGSNQASIRAGRYSTGLEQDLKNTLQTYSDDILSPQMKTRLLNEALEYASVNTRQLGLYNDMLEEIRTLEALLRSKCQPNDISN
jgi:hypothetical protein